MKEIETQSYQLKILKAVLKTSSGFRIIMVLGHTSIWRIHDRFQLYISYIDIKSCMYDIIKLISQNSYNIFLQIFLDNKELCLYPF